MNEQHLDIEEEKPLDPAAEKLRRKMLRLMVISLGSMFIGIFAVLFAIVYKMNNSAVASTSIETSISLPEGFEIEETSLGDDLIVFRGVHADGSRQLVLFDLANGTPRGTIDLN